MNQRKIGIVLNYLNIFLHLAIALVYVPLLLSFIGKAEYGLYQLIGSVITYFGIMDFGLGTAVSRYYKQYLVKQDVMGCENILGLSMRIFGGIAVLMLALGGVVYYNLDAVFKVSLTIAELALAKQLFLVLLFNIIMSMVTLPFITVINAHERFLFVKGIATVRLVLQPVVVWLVLCQYPSALSVVLVQTGLHVIVVGLYLYYCFRELNIRIKYHFCEEGLLKEFGRMAFNTFLVAIVDQFFLRTNQIVLGIISGTGEVAVYALGAYVYTQYITFSCAIIGVYFPYVNELVAKNASKEMLSDFFIEMGRRQFYVLGLILSGFVIFGQQFVRYWAGKSFGEAYFIALLVMLPYTIDLIQNAGILIMQAKNQYGFRAKTYLVTGLLHLGLSVYMGLKWGGVGCAWATFIAVFLSNGLVMNWYYYKVQGLDILRFWSNIAGIAAKIVLFALPMYVLNAATYVDSKLVFLVKIGVYTVLYVVLCYKRWLNPREKEGFQRTRFVRGWLCPKPKLEAYPEIAKILQQPLTRSGLAQYAKACQKLPTRYVWGAMGRYVDVLLLDQVRKLYPDHYKEADYDRFRQDYGKKILAFDCVGLIKTYYMGGPSTPQYVPEGDVNTEGMLERALRQGYMDCLPEEPGLVLYMEGHVGIYIGKGRVIEATSNEKFGNGVVETKLEDRLWTRWLACPFIEDK